MLYTLATRSSMSISALHERSPLFVALSDGSVRNDYTVRFLNKAGVSRSFTLEVLGLPAAEIRASGIEPGADGKLIVEVGPDQTRELRASVQVPAASSAEGSNRHRVQGDGQQQPARPPRFGITLFRPPGNPISAI